jgi:hypothetical protein
MELHKGKKIRRKHFLKDSLILNYAEGLIYQLPYLVWKREMSHNKNKLN